MNDLSYLVPVEQACSHIPTLGLTDSHLPACDSLCWKNTLVRRNHGQCRFLTVSSVSFANFSPSILPFLKPTTTGAGITPLF